MQAEATGQMQEAVHVLRSALGEALQAVYLHGSAVSGGLRPRSDIDLLAVVDRPLTLAQRREMVAALLRISGRYPAPPGGPRCLEVMVFAKPELAALPYPACAEFTYGEWLRDAFEAGEAPTPVRDPENTLVLAQARGEACALFGPEAAALLPEVPMAEVRRAMRDLLPRLLEGLEGDERNVLLTLARMWRTAETGAFVTKDAAAAWAVPHLTGEAAATLRLASEAYSGRAEDDRAEDDWAGRRIAARRTAEVLSQRVFELLEGQGKMKTPIC